MSTPENYIEQIRQAYRQEVRDQIHKNSHPVTLEDADGKTLGTLLEENILKWPPRDRRIGYQLSGDDRYDFEITQVQVTRYKMMDLRVLKREPMNGGISIGIFLVGNQTDFEEYNALVEQHNDLYEESLDESGFDPETGAPRGNQTVQEYWPYKRHDGPEPPIVYELDTLPGCSKPIAKYKHVATIKLQLRVNKGWVLEGSVTNKNNQYLWKGSVSNEDLSEATVQIIHQIFGNHQCSVTGEPYRGLNLLLSGKKAHGGNAAPDITKPSGSYKMNQALEILFRYLIPAVTMPLGAIVGVIGAQAIHSNNFLYGGIIGILIPIISVNISKHFYNTKKTLRAEAQEL
jgi:hypothetical protein